jgi:hypothetical protein
MALTEEAPRTRRAWRWTNAAVLALGILGLLPLALPGLLLWESLPHVDPRDADLGAKPAMDGLLVYFLFAVLVMVLSNGLPVAAHWSARGSLGGAVLQGVCGTAVIGWAWFGAKFGVGSYFTGTDDACTYPNCWPVHTEEKYAWLPGLVVGLVLIAMASLLKPVPWWVRTVVPVVVGVAALRIHHWYWVTQLLPVFEAPPG